MRKYYTRPCNFYHGGVAKKLVNSSKALPLNGRKNIAFDTIELFTRSGRKIESNFIYFKNINRINIKARKVIKKDLEKITKKRKNFLKHVDFSKPSIMGVLNLTPDSFSDGGKFYNHNEAFKHISNMINSGAKIIDIGGESTRPGSKTIPSKIEWKRIQNVIKKFKKKYKSVCLSVDTRKSEIMSKSIKYGADLINDVSGFNFDNYSLFELDATNISKVLHHMQGTPNTMQIKPKYENVLLDIYDFF